jgi:3-phenylpropionate/trans-cinnamate dioxygenase ferredoxin subunit
MSDYVKIATLNDVKPGKMFRAEINNHAILLANIENEIYAIDDMCTHEDASLYKGALKGHCVECSLHGSHFDFRTGVPDGNPATEAVNTYKVKIKDNEIFILFG